MVSKKSFKLLVVSSTMLFFAFVRIIYFLDCGSVVANKFVQGLQNLGFGKYSPTSKSFKRFRPNDENCPDRENLKKNIDN